MSGHSDVVGDAGIMAPSKKEAKLSGDSRITGTLYLESGVKLDLDGKKDPKVGAIKNADLSALKMQVLDLINADTHMSATQRFDDIKKSKVIQGNSKVNVIEVEGDIHLSGKNYLELSGQASDVFILNVEGKVRLSGSSAIRVGGTASANKVFIHVLGHDERHAGRCTEKKAHGRDFHLSGDSHVDGNVFVFDGKAHLSGKSVLHGALLIAGKAHLTGKSQITGLGKCAGVATTRPAPDRCDDDDKDCRGDCDDDDKDCSDCDDDKGDHGDQGDHDGDKGDHDSDDPYEGDHD